MKIASKMGISTIQSYAGSQIFEAVGLSQEVSRQVLHQHRLPRGRHRPSTRSRSDLEARHQQAFDPLGLDITPRAAQPGRPQVPQRRRCRGAPVQSRRPSTCCSRPCWTGNYDTVQAVHRRCGQRGRRRACTCAACWTSTIPRSACPWTKWRAWTPSSSASRPAAMSYGSHCPRKPTSAWPLP